MNHETELGSATVSGPTPDTTPDAGAAGGSDAGTPRPPGARRRRRGGRGRGRGGGAKAPSASDTAPDEPRSTPAEAAPGSSERAGSGQGQRTTQARPRSRSGAAKGRPAPADGTVAEKAEKAEKAAKAAEPTAVEPALTGDRPADGSAPTAARRTRRRGGRGRGGRKPAGATLGADDRAPIDATADTQREDALPDAGPATGGEAPQEPNGRRRRGRRGSGATKRTTDGPPEDDAKATAKRPARRTATEPDAEPERSSRRRSERSIEERVAAGGPTRGIRSSRSRVGRVGGRRRREETIVAPRITDKVMVITEHGDRDQIAVLEEDQLVQHYVTRTGAHSMVGNIYLGRVQNVLPGMEAAFVDVGRGRNGVLYAGEVNYAPEDLEGAAPRIEQVLKNGQSVMVQVTKDPMGGKGARLTAQISLPGRFLVFAPNQSLSGISRRVPDTERRRLKSILRAIKPDEHGIIVRTAAEGASEEALTADLERLVREWNDIVKRSKRSKAPAVLYEEPELTVRVVRDLFTDGEFKVLATDSPRVHGKVMEYVADVAPDLADKVRLHTGKLPVFEEYRVVEQIHKALDRKVWLPSGGYLIIERTEAMTIVDVNTGKSVGKTNLEATVVNTNLEAARETARQLRLRDIGGIIVIDFIDMLLEQNKQQVEATMKEALAVDKTRSQVFEIGPLGLMQVTRKRVSSGLVESFSETCPTCEGRGILVNYEA
jgi:ribonuclease E